MDKAKETTDEAKKDAARCSYTLLRAFAYTFNFFEHPEKEADRNYIPNDFEAELKEVLTDKYYPKYAAAIKATKEEYEKELPQEISAEVVERLLKFVSVKENDHIVRKYEAKLTDFTEKIDAKKKERDAIAPPREKREPSKRQRKDKKKRRNSQSSNDTPLEDQLATILKEVGKRTNSVRFSKDDFESYSEAQNQLDALMRETVSEIVNMKQRLRKRFARVQSKKRTSRRRSSSRRSNRD